MPKFKAPKLPRCPNIAELRSELRDISKQIREARLRYIEQCFKASMHLQGKSLAVFLKKVAETMQANGLYAKQPKVGEVAWCVARWFGRFEVGTNYWHRNKWWLHRGLTDEIVHAMRGRRRWQMEMLAS